jgi:hypothetical protein
MINELKREGQTITRKYKNSHEKTLREKAEYYHFSCEAEKAARIGITENSKEKQESAEKIEQKWVSKSEDKLKSYVGSIRKTNEILENYKKIIPPIMDNLQQNEESRIQFMKNSLDKYLRYFRRFEKSYHLSLEKFEKSVFDISASEDIRIYVESKIGDQVFKQEEFMKYDEWKKSLNENEYEIMEKEPDMSAIITYILTQNTLNLESSILNEVYGLINNNEGRRIFVELLEGCECKNINRDNLNLLSQLIRSMMDQIVNKKEYDAYLFCKLLELSTKYSTADDQKVFLCELLSGHLYWNETVRWIQAINYGINSKIVILESAGRKDLNSIEESDNIEKIETTSAYVTISQFVYQLSRLDIPKTITSEIILKICAEYQISHEKSSLLLVELNSRSKNNYKPTRRHHKSLTSMEFILKKSSSFLQTIDLIKIGSINRNLSKHILRLRNLRTYKLRKVFFLSNKTMRRKLWLDSLDVSSLSSLDFTKCFNDFSINEEKYSEICRIIDMDIARSYQKGC